MEGNHRNSRKYCRCYGGDEPALKEPCNIPGPSSSAFSTKPSRLKAGNPLGFSAFAEKLFPILIDSGTLPKASILTCRLLNKHVKTIVDKELLGSRKPAWLTEAFTLETSLDIHQFMEKFDGMQRSHGCLTPLFASHLNLLAGTHNMNTVELLRKYGALLQKVRLAITHSAECPRPFSTGIHMFAALSCLPKVVTLTLAFEKMNCELHEMYWELAQSEAPPFNKFPRLKSLLELNLECLLLPISMSDTLFYPPPIIFLEPFLKACGAQLRKLSCHQSFIDDIGFDEIFSANLSNIHELKLDLVDFEGESAVQSLCLMQNAKLQRLVLRRAKNGHYFYENDGKLGNNDEDILLTASLFKDTLEELQLYKLINAKGLKDLNIDLSKTILQKLRGLTVTNDNVDSEMWDLFRSQFPNLEWIRFELEVKYNYVKFGSYCDSSDADNEDSPDSQKDEEEDHSPPPIPDAAVRKRFFNMFPKLNSLIWIKKLRKGTGRAPLEISFSRPMQRSVNAKPSAWKGAPDNKLDLVR